MNKQIVHIPIGPPGSGKSTWSRGLLEMSENTVRVSRDDLRRMRGKYWIPAQENMITEMEDSCIDIALEFEHDIIIDGANTNMKYLKARIKSLINKYGKKRIAFNFRFFDIGLDECILRDSKREGDECVGEEVINRMYDQFENLKSNFFEVEELIRTY